MCYLSQLNERQLEAVKCTEGYLRVIAGAGSGKTKLLVSRYAYLVKEYGIDSSNILCVTFTNKAAGEMKRRIRRLIGDEYDTSLICTYHGFCVKVLREDVEKVFYPKEFQIMDTAQQKALLADIYQKFDLKLDHGSFEKIVAMISKVKSQRFYVEKMCCTEKCKILPSCDSLDDEIIEEYLQRQKQVYAMDFDDLMYFTLYVFARFPQVLQKWQDKLNYIQVDEFQDSSSTEMELIDLLTGKHHNLMIVGDPDQNIYEWRGSDVGLLVNFDKKHYPTETIFLNQNYRSTPQILTCANTLIENNELRLKKDLFTDRPRGASVYHYHSKNEYDEAEAIINIIHNVMKEDGASFADFAVLYRSGFLSRIVEKKFTENGIPYEIYGGVKFYQRMEIQDIMAYLRLVAFDDDLAFKRIVNKPRRRFGRTKMHYLQSICPEGTSLYSTLKSYITDPVFKGSGASEFIDVVDSIRAELALISLADVVDKVCTLSGYEKYIRELGDMERFENLTEFKRIASEYEENFGENVTLRDFINQISLQAEDNGEESPDMVKLMTIHASKGLEFPNVMVMGLSEGIFPSAKTIEERKNLGLEEERRLCYVAITRAEKRLYLLDSEGFAQNGSSKLPSRFLKEIGEENFIRIGTISKDLQDRADEYVAKTLGKSSVKALKEVDSRVTHPAFGEGVILSYDESKRSYKIKFDKLNSERDISADFFTREHKVVQPEKKSYGEAQTVKDSAAKALSVTSINCDSENCADSYNTDNAYIAAVNDSITDEACLSAKDAGNNLWQRNDVPHSGWHCVGVEDLGSPSGVCRMCGHQIIRYVHYMKHPDFSTTLGVGCICAGKMEGDIEKAKNREQSFKSKQSRRATFLSKGWKISKSNNKYKKVKEHIVVLFCNKHTNRWNYSIDGVFCKDDYDTWSSAANAAFEQLEK